jgi:penicillin-binding protein
MVSQLTNVQKAILIIKKALFVFWIGFKWIFIFGLVSMLLAGGVVAGYITSLVKDDPIRDKAAMIEAVNQNDLTGFVYFNDGQPIGQLRAEEDRRLAKSIDEIPQVIKDAFIAVEDHRFETHYGMDPIGTIRAAKQKFLNEDTQTGGSTLTQQLARRVFLSLEQTDSRKFKEIFLAMRMERIFTKDEIILAYLNKMPFGNGSNGYNAYGIKAAAKGIFDMENLNRINTAQAAYLAGLVKAPSDYSAFSGRGKFDEEGFNKAMDRQKVVLSEMLKYDKITREEYEQAVRFDIKSTLAETKEKAYTTYPYLMIEAERRAAEVLLQMQNPTLTTADLRSKANAEQLKDAIDMMNRSGYKIYTSIDKTIYDAMQEIAKNPENYSKDHPEKGIEQTGAMMIENATGRILGMIEGRDYYIEQMNHATQMTRQPGSAMKIMAYLPALDTGLISPGSPIDDSPIILKDGSKGAHIPVNHNNKYHGFLSARQAFNQSYNIPALKLFLADYGGVGIETAWDYAKKMGITTLTNSDYQSQTGVIGGLTYGVSVEELTNAFSTVSNKGEFVDAFMIEKILDANDKLVYQHIVEPVSVFSEETAYLMTDMMRTVISNGTASVVRNNFEHYGKIPIYGKTGTTSNDYDVWFVGFSPDISLGVWTGYDQQTTLVGSDGRNRSKLIWAKIMNAAVEKHPEWFESPAVEQPATIVKGTVSGVSGKLPNELTSAIGMLSSDLFNKSFLPREEEDMLVNASYIRYNNFNFIPQPTTPADFIEQKVLINRTKSNKAIYDEITAIFEQYPKAVPVSKGVARSPSYYMTIDSQLDAPTDMDPRIDDGTAPDPPTQVALTKEGGNYRITFVPAAAEDIVGYRIYMSNNLAPFAKFEGLVVYSGQDPHFLVGARSPNDTFYLTAVDVAGKESQPSQYVFSSDGSFDPSLLPPVNGTTPDQGEDLDDILDLLNPGGSDQETPTSPGSTTGSSGTVGSTVPASPTGVSVKSNNDGVSIVIEWQANAAADSVIKYNIYYSSVVNGTYNYIHGTEKNRLEYFPIVSEGWYYVTAVNASGESAPSQAVEMKASN